MNCGRDGRGGFLSRDFLCWLFHFLFCLFVSLFSWLEIFAAGKDGIVFAAEDKKRFMNFLLTPSFGNMV